MVLVKVKSSKSVVPFMFFQCEAGRNFRQELKELIKKLGQDGRLVQILKYDRQKHAPIIAGAKTEIERLIADGNKRATRLQLWLSEVEHLERNCVL